MEHLEAVSAFTAAQVNELCNTHGDTRTCKVYGCDQRAENASTDVGAGKLDSPKHQSMMPHECEGAKLPKFGMKKHQLLKRSRRNGGVDGDSGDGCEDYGSTEGCGRRNDDTGSIRALQPEIIAEVSHIEVAMKYEDAVVVGSQDHWEQGHSQPTTDVKNSEDYSNLVAKALQCADEVRANFISSTTGSNLFSDGKELIESHQILTADSPRAVDNIDYCSIVADTLLAESAPIPPGSSNMCRDPGCSKWRQLRGLCYTHVGYPLCKVDGCNQRAATQYLCRDHGGGTKCNFGGCDKFSACFGYCHRHARLQGIDSKRRCMANGCRKFRSKGEYCSAHGLKKKVGEQLSCELGQDEQLTSAGSTKSDDVQSQYSSNKNEATQSRLGYKREGHKMCIVNGCRKWAMQYGYCRHHQNIGAIRDESSTATPPEVESTLEELFNSPGLTVAVADSLDKKHRSSASPASYWAATSSLY